MRARRDTGTGGPRSGPSLTGWACGGSRLAWPTEHLAAAGGSLRAGPSPRGGLAVTAGLP
ncbi:hypothetical protein ACWEQC_36775 [Streptomyces shenzhenensis]